MMRSLTAMSSVALAVANVELNFLPDAECGTNAKNVNETGIFKLSIGVVGQQGFTYNCSTNYDPAVGVAENDCIEWIPTQVLSDKEGLDVTLFAHDVSGKQAMCMKWELAFDGQRSGQKVWAPAEADPNKFAEKMELINRTIMETAAGDDIEASRQKRNNTKESRVLAMHRYLDSMTHTSHRCVPQGEPGYWNAAPPKVPYLPRIPNPFSPWAFPPTAESVLQTRLSHALLGSTGTIWSIDRACKDAWKINVPVISHESCVPTIPGYPHCHVDCQQTWTFGPGGVFSRGISTLNHLIRSPDLMLADDSSTDVKEYGYLGCGDKSIIV